MAQPSIPRSTSPGEQGSQQPQQNAAIDSERTLMRTYRLQWERVQEFNLPIGSVCTSVSVNPVMGEIMFACRHRGLLHYAWNKDHGVVYADMPCRVSYADWGNIRIVKCEQDSGAYAVVNDNTMALVMLGQQRLAPPSPQAMIETSAREDSINMGDGSNSSALDDSLCASGTNNSEMQTNSPANVSPDDGARAGAGAAGGLANVGQFEFVDFESERCSVGDVRDVVIDTENERIYLLYKDRLCRRLYPDMRGYSEVASSRTLSKCIGSELVCLAHSKRLLYLLTKSGDVKVRLKLEKMSSLKTSSEMIWRPIGEQLKKLVPNRKEALSTYRNVSKQLRMGGRPTEDSRPVSTVTVADTLITSRLTFLPKAHRQPTNSHTPDILANRLQRLLGSDERSFDELDAAMSVSEDPACIVGQGIEDAASLAEAEEEQTLLPELAGACVDSRRDILFASTGEPNIYALWLLSPSADSSQAPIEKDWWLEDAKIDLSGPPLKKPFVAGAIACASTSARKPGFLYAVDRNDCRRVLVLRYTAEACTGAVGPDLDGFLEGSVRASYTPKESFISSNLSPSPF